jgi:hypothetical protein
LDSNEIEVIRVCVCVVKSRYFSRLFQTCSQLTVQILLIKIHQYREELLSTCTLKKYKENSAYFLAVFILGGCCVSLRSPGLMFGVSEKVAKGACLPLRNCYVLPAQH